MSDMSSRGPDPGAMVAAGEADLAYYLAQRSPKNTSMTSNAEAQGKRKLPAAACGQLLKHSFALKGSPPHGQTRPHCTDEAEWPNGLEVRNGHPRSYLSGIPSLF